MFWIKQQLVHTCPHPLKKSLPAIPSWCAIVSRSIYYLIGLNSKR